MRMDFLHGQWLKFGNGQRYNVWFRVVQQAGDRGIRRWIDYRYSNIYQLHYLYLRPLQFLWRIGPYIDTPASNGTGAASAP
jgi:hypothetical protein